MRGTRTMGWLCLFVGFATLAVFVSAADLGNTTALVGVIFVAYGFALATAPNAGGPRVCGKTFLAWGAVHVICGVLALTPFFSMPGATPLLGPIRAVVVGLLWSAYGLSLNRGLPAARSWGWPVVTVLQAGVTPLGLTLLAFAIGFTRYVRGSPEYVSQPAT